MTQAERDRLVALKKAKKSVITQRKAADELKLSVRQVQRLLEGLRKEGDKAVVHGLRGKAFRGRHMWTSLTLAFLPCHRGACLESWCNGPRRLSMRFQGRAESFGPMWFKTKSKVKTKSQGGNRPPPAGRPRARAKERVGRTTPFSSSAMSSAPAIPRSGCSPALPVSASPAHAD
jgi:Homeodomain-like domain